MHSQIKVSVERQNIFNLFFEIIETKTKSHDRSKLCLQIQSCSKFILARSQAWLSQPRNHSLTKISPILTTCHRELLQEWKFLSSLNFLQRPSLITLTISMYSPREKSSSFQLEQLDAELWSTSQMFWISDKFQSSTTPRNQSWLETSARKPPSGRLRSHKASNLARTKEFCKSENLNNSFLNSFHRNREFTKMR